MTSNSLGKMIAGKMIGEGTGQWNKAERGFGRVETQSKNFLVSTPILSLGSFRHSLVPIPLSGSSRSYHFAPYHFAEGLLSSFRTGLDANH